MSLNTVPEDQLPSSGDELEKIDFPASCSFQSICQKLDKHGAWQQLGTKGISFHKKVDYCLMSEVRSHFIGRWKTPWSCCHGGTGWATTSCKETCLRNPLRGLKKNTGGGSKKITFLQIALLGMPLQELHWQACLSGPPVWSHHRWQEYVPKD